MRQGISFLITIFCLIHSGCITRKESLQNVGIKPPKIIESKAHELSPHEISPPDIVTTTGVKRIRAGQPEIVQLKSNIFPARATRIVLAGIPKLIIKGGGNFKPPKVVHAINSNCRKARPPEIIPLMDPFVKESNPASFSAIKAMHGLNSNEISSLLQDRSGNIWIGAWWGGVSKYDGRYLSNYSIAQGISSDFVGYVFEDKDRNIWIGTEDGGLNKLDGKFITHYTTAEGLSNNTVRYIFQDKNGDMWFATGNGLNKFDGNCFTHYTTDQGLPSNNILNLYEDHKGNFWVGTEGGMTKFDNNTFQNYTYSLGLPEKTGFGNMLEDDDGNLWFGTSAGICKYDGNYISQYTTEGGLSSNRISKISKDTYGGIWIGTWDRGANRYDGKTFTHLSVAQGLSNEVVTTILQDMRGNIWMATTAGVNKFDGKLFSHVVPLRQEEVECLFSDSKGNLWIGTGAGNSINRYDGKSLARYTIKQGLFSTSINQIIEDKHGNIWFAERGGVDKFDGKYFTHYAAINGLINDVVFCLLEDKEGNLWFGTDNGLSKFDGKQFTNYSITPGEKGVAIYALIQDHQGTIWIGTAGNGVYSFDGNSFTHFDPAHSVSHPMVLGLMEDKDYNIWMCTGFGVNKFDGKHFTWYTTEQGLSNNIAKNALQDKNGNIWIGTINGINLLKPAIQNSDSSKNMQLSLFKKYTVAEGFSGGGTYENSITQDNSGNIWIGATDRVALYHPLGDTPDTIAPVIQLQSISLFNESINWLGLEKKRDTAITLSNGRILQHFNFSTLSRWYNQPENLELSYDNNFLTFQFIGISTYRSKEIRYQYYLEGLEQSWSNITSQNEATYSNLPYGKYTLKVKAVNSEGYWSKELNYPFAILPPWWRTNWAYLGYAISTIALIWIFIWFRSSQLKRENLQLEEKVSKRTIELEHSLQERFLLTKKVESQDALLKERLRISRELHDDIGSTLGSISIYSEVAKKRSAKKENAIEVLSKIGSASRELIDKMSDIVWSLNPGNENFDQLKNRMMAFAAMILTPGNILYDFSVDEKLNRIQFSSEQRKNIFLIFKESLHNIVKYSDCKTASIKLQMDEACFGMTIVDDGKGFNILDSTVITSTTDHESLGGNGIKNMRARAEELNAQFCIDSKIGEGTTVRLKLAL